MITTLLCSRWYNDDLCALAFKVLHDKQRGPLVFLRIYSGTLKPQTAVHNINRNSTYATTRTRRLSPGFTSRKRKKSFLSSCFYPVQREDEQAARPVCRPARGNPLPDGGEHRLDCRTQAGGELHIPIFASCSVDESDRFSLSLSVWQTVTGDTIVSSKASAAATVRRAHAAGGGDGAKRGEQASVVLSGVEVPDPVFFCTIEPPTMAKQAGE